MCGIFGMVGQGPVVGHLVAGLRSLEYRGYDSAGVAVAGAGRIERRRARGRLANLAQLLESQPVEGGAGIAHTRWATHGPPTEANAHPHATPRVAVVHNGIIENFQSLRAELVAAGARFESQTDTEVVPHLVTAALERGLSPVDALRAATARLRGQFALAVLFAGHDDLVLATRRGSPLVVGLAAGRTTLASDATALAGHASEVVFLEDGDIAQLRPWTVHVEDASGRPVERRRESLTGIADAAALGGHAHYMRKEILEQPAVLARSLARFRDAHTGAFHVPALPFDFAKLTRLTLVGCGTSFQAAQVAKYWFERYARLPVDIDIASEFRYRAPPIDVAGASIFLSQSGETADTLAALRLANDSGQPTLAIVNATRSTMAREASAFVGIEAGPEIGVASTKAFTAQLTMLALLTLEAARARKTLDDAEIDALGDALAILPHAVQGVLGTESTAERLAWTLAGATSAVYVGRGTSLPLAFEGALKLKEIAYVHAEGFGAGELKHGPLALIDESIPVVAVAPSDALFEKTVSNLHEIAARGGRILAVTDAAGAAHLSGLVADTIVMPATHPLLAPIVAAIPLQFLAYHAALARGHDVDRPRNLAKSVTVE